MDATIPLTCPYCYQITYSEIDTNLPELTYTEDCQNCCHPLKIRVHCEQGQVEQAAADKDE